MSPVVDFDGAWKSAFQAHFRPSLQLLFPDIAARIDWNRPIEFLDQELQAIMREDEQGLKRADLLVRVFRRDGTEEWLLIHIEIQSQKDPNLPLRMFAYYVRILERYGRPVVSLAVLADDVPGWKPSVYEAETWGCRLRFEYPVCKLLELDRAALERSENAMALVVSAYFWALETRLDMEARRAAKWRLVRGLYERGWKKEDIQGLFRLIDWMIALPDELEVEFRRDLLQYEQEKAMPYVTSIERLGREEGRREGRLQALQSAVASVLRARFGALPATVAEKIHAVADEASLERALCSASTAPTLAHFLQSL